MKMTDKIDGGQGREIEIRNKDLKVMMEREIRKKFLRKRISNFI